MMIAGVKYVYCTQWHVATLYQTASNQFTAAVVVIFMYQCQRQSSFNRVLELQEKNKIKKIPSGVQGRPRGQGVRE